MLSSPKSGYRPSPAATALLATLLLAPGLLAQTPRSLGRPTGNLLIADASADSIVSLRDLDGDGLYNGPGEARTFYDDALGTFTLTNPASIATGPDGSVYVADTSRDQILRLIDRDGDGTALGPTESEIWFDGTPGGNASGLLMANPLGITVDGAGVVFVAAAGTSSVPTDRILRLENLGGLPGANDAGEATSFRTLSFPGIGDSIPAAVAIDLFGGVLFTETGATGVRSKGIYRLSDSVVLNGNADDPGEETPYFLPPAPFDNGFHFGITVDDNGIVYVTDHGNDIIWRLEDRNFDFTIDPATEASIWWSSNGSSLLWGLAVDDQGRVFGAESQNPDRILRFEDALIPNGNVNDPGEVVAVYDETLSGFDIRNPRAITFQRGAFLAARGPTRLGLTPELVYVSQPRVNFEVWFSSRRTMVPIAPFGTLQIGIDPTDQFGTLISTTADSTGRFELPIFIPNDPSLIGFTLHLQAIEFAPEAPRLSTALSVTIGS